ncbi:alpha/beta-hydrolase, partial [Caulochytrium protostelioides]
MARFSATTVALAALALLNLLGTGPVPCAADVALGTPASAQNETLTMGAPSPSPPPPPPSAQDYFVGELPGMQLDTFNTTLRMHAGYVTVQQPQDQQLFFWQFDATVRRDRNVLLIWLNGGPGCSSLDGLFLENGPLKVIDKDHVAWNPYGWNQYADVLYVDQPAGTGFSTGQIKDYAHTETEIVERFLSFYDRYLEIFPQHRDAELYFAGESYAGTYLPYITAAMLKRNEAAGRDIYRIQSLLIGNGWIDPLRQYAGYETFAVANGLLPLGTSYATLYQERWA